MSLRRGSVFAHHMYEITIDVALEVSVMAAESDRKASRCVSFAFRCDRLSRVYVLLCVHTL